MLSTAKLISFDKEMKFEIGDTDYNAMKSLDNKVDSGEKVEDILEENEETGSILQDETNKENTKKQNR